MGIRAGGAPAASAELAPDAGVPALPAASAVQAMAAGVPAAPGGPDVPGPPDVASHSSPAARAESPRAAGIASATPANAGPVTQPVTPLPSSSSRPAGDAARAQPPGSWTSPLWGTPVDLPRAIELVPVTGETDRRAPSRPGPLRRPPDRDRPPALAASRTRPGPSRPSRRHRPPDQDRPPQPARGRTRPGPSRPSRRPAPGPGPATDSPPASRTRPEPSRPSRRRPAAGTPPAGSAPGGPTAVRDLIPPPAPAPRPVAMPGPEPGEPHQKPRVSGRAPRIDRHDRGHRPPAGSACPPDSRDPASGAGGARLDSPSFPARRDRGRRPAAGRAPPLVRDRTGLTAARDDARPVRGDRLPDRAREEPVDDGADLDRGRRQPGGADVHAEFHRAGAGRGAPGGRSAAEHVPLPRRVGQRPGGPVLAAADA